ncbi:GspH/FimT family pseudopilin [Thermomonas sp. LB-4]|uniref:GspH/FimT family pseudopilin n=1 Tax=Thermomonas sp. LB-4 TaxID=3102790 RepID=UPI002EDB956D
MTRRPAGFTLIELLTTTSIVAILAGVAASPMSALLERHRANTAASSLIAHMQLARMAAVSRNRRAVLCPSSDGAHCDGGTDWSPGWLLFVDDDGNRQPDAADEILRGDREPTSRHLRIVSSAGRQQLRYLPDGTSGGSNLTLSICSPKGDLLARVIVNNVGRPRSERPSAALPCPR